MLHIITDSEENVIMRLWISHEAPDNDKAQDGDIWHDLRHEQRFINKSGVWFLL